VLQPVVENACLYGRTAVKVSIARERTHIVYRVSDDGPGVAPDELESIFEPGCQGAVGRTNGGAAGLGLALARRLARSVRGDVTASAGDAGGTFVVRLPAA
jgi:signal transduction histidine kinase